MCGRMDKGEREIIDADDEKQPEEKNWCKHIYRNWDRVWCGYLRWNERLIDSWILYQSYRTNLKGNAVPSSIERDKNRLLLASICQTWLSIKPLEPCSMYISAYVLLFHMFSFCHLKHHSCGFLFLLTDSLRTRLYLLWDISSSKTPIFCRTPNTRTHGEGERIKAFKRIFCIDSDCHDRHTLCCLIFFFHFYTPSSNEIHILTWCLIYKPDRMTFNNFLSSALHEEKQREVITISLYLWSDIFYEFCCSLLNKTNPSQIEKYLIYLISSIFEYCY